MGRFTLAKYAADNGDIRPVRVRPFTLSAANPEATGSLTAGSSRVRAGGSRRGLGTVAREITISLPIGDGADIFETSSVSVTVPIMTIAAYNALSVGADYAYRGATWKIASKRGESSR